MKRRRALPTTSKSGEAGFTLVELMVAMGILLVSLLGLLEVVSLATGYNMRNVLRDEAVLIAEDQMSDLMRRPQSSVPAFQVLSSPSRVRGGGRTYTVTRSATRASTTDSYQFTVQVRWDLKGVTSSHEVRAMRTFVNGK